MFELFYLGRVIEFVEKYPRETIAGVTAIVISHHLTSIKQEKVKAEAKVEAARVELQCELIRLETAKFEAQNRTN